MQNPTITPDPHNLGYVISFIEEPSKQTRDSWIRINSDTELRRNLLLAWIGDALHAAGYGNSLLGRIATALPIKDGRIAVPAGGLLLVILMILALATLAVPVGWLIAPETNLFLTVLLYAGGALACYAATVAVWYSASVQAKLAFAPRRFTRRLTLSAYSGEITIWSEFDQLTWRARNAVYRGFKTNLAAVTGIEESGLDQISPAARGEHRDPMMAYAMAVSLYTSDGNRLTLWSDTSGQDAARRIRTQLAGIIHQTRHVYGHVQRLITARAWNENTAQEAAAMLYGSEQSAQSSHTLHQPHSQAAYPSTSAQPARQMPQPFSPDYIPPEDRL